MEINLLYLIPFSLFILFFWVGGFVFMFLNIMRSDPREIEFRTDSGQDLALLPKEVKIKKTTPFRRIKKLYGDHPQFS